MKTKGSARPLSRSEMRLKVTLHLMLCGIVYLIGRQYLSLVSFFDGASNTMYHLDYPILLHTSLADDEQNTLTGTQTDVVIFYNIYLSDSDEETYARGVDIVKEQVEQIGSSTLIQSQSTTTDLFYVSLGAPVDHSWLQDELCEPHKLNCHRLQHYTTGYEEKTLAPLHSFCQQNPTKVVIYLHNKGSYHHMPEQDSWRWHMTEAVLDDQCWTNLVSPSTDDTLECDTCGLLFRTIPAEHYTGNIWMAKCSYIQHLHSPATLREKRNTTITTFNQSFPMIQYAYCPATESATGSGRFLYEHWLGSNPSIKACDLSTTNMDTYWKADMVHRDVQVDFALNRAPRYKVWTTSTPVECRVNQWTVQSNWKARLSEATFLPGKLLRWCIEYGVLPVNSSWVWSHYPEGELFRQAVLERQWMLSGDNNIDCTQLVRYILEDVARLKSGKT
jgi:hypothetical protein